MAFFCSDRKKTLLGRLLTTSGVVAFCVVPHVAFAQDKVRVETQYDARGQVLRQSQPYYSGETVRWIEYRHDSMDRQILLTHPGGKTVATRYFSGDFFSAVEVTDENGNKRVTHFDEFGNEIYRDRFDAGSRMRTTYEYDALNRLTGITDPLGSGWSYLYDGHGNRVRSQDPDLGCRQMTYDAANRLIEQRAADGALITYSYDELDRVVGKIVDKNALQFSDCSSGNPPTNRIPRAIDDAGGPITPGLTTVINVLANDSDPDGNILTVTALNGTAVQPDGQVNVAGGAVTLNQDKSLTYQSNVGAPGNHSFTYTISDGYLEASGTVTVQVQDPNVAPVVANAIADQTATEGTVWSFTIPANTFSDANGDNLTYSASLANGSALPSWLSFATGTRAFTGTPPTGSNGTVSLKVSASDGTASVDDTFDLVVSEPGVLTGTSGNDVFVYNLGDGSIQVIDGTGMGNDDKLQLGAGIASNSVTVSKSVNNGVILHIAGGGQIELVEQFAAGTDRGVEQIVFDNGETWGSGTVASMALAALATSGDDQVVGFEDGSGTIVGLAGNDWLYGGSGPDVFNPGPGIDNLDGGSGTDTADYSQDSGGIYARAGNNWATSVSNWSMSWGDLIQGMQDDTIEHDDFVSIEDVVGTNFYDVLIGTPGPNTLKGLDGDDNIAGHAGDDILYGGPDDDKIMPGAGSDYVDGGTGTDTVDYTDEPTGLYIRHYNGFSTPIANQALGWTALIAAINNDTIEHDDLVGIENVIGSPYDDVVAGTNGPNTIWGRNGDDYLSGHNDNDILYGENGKDQLLGGAGTDTLAGGPDEDILKGNADADEFVFAANDGATALADADLIQDFEDGLDKIRITGGPSFNHLTISDDGSGNATVFDNANNKYVVVVQNTPASALTASDFIFSAQ